MTSLLFVSVYWKVLWGYGASAQAAVVSSTKQDSHRVHGGWKNRRVEQWAAWPPMVLPVPAAWLSAGTPTHWAGSSAKVLRGFYCGVLQVNKNILVNLLLRGHVKIVPYERFSLHRG